MIQLTYDEVPNWVKAAIEIEGVGVEPRCSSCNQFDICDHDDTTIRKNKSVVCDRCGRLLSGEPEPSDEFCGGCGRKWVRC